MDEIELKRLKKLLNYWIEHNKEHSEEFREWAEKAKDLGDGVIYQDIVNAAQYMVKANESLQGASEALKETDA